MTVQPRALDAYQRSLDLYPNRFNSLLCAARAARSSGDDAAARSFYSALLEAAVGSPRDSVLDEARGVMQQQR